jgi:hypothetical protein
MSVASPWFGVGVEVAVAVALLYVDEVVVLVRIALSRSSGLMRHSAWRWASCSTRRSSAASASWVVRDGVASMPVSCAR